MFELLIDLILFSSRMWVPFMNEGHLSSLQRQRVGTGFQGEHARYTMQESTGDRMTVSWIAAHQKLKDYLHCKCAEFQIPMKLPIFPCFIFPAGITCRISLSLSKCSSSRHIAPIQNGGQIQVVPWLFGWMHYHGGKPARIWQWGYHIQLRESQ